MYQYKVVHRPEKRIANADALSCLPLDEYFENENRPLNLWIEDCKVKYDLVLLEVHGNKIEYHFWHRSKSHSIGNKSARQ